MSFRIASAGAVALVALFAAGCVDDVDQEASQPFIRAAFDPAIGAIPTPNDLALQSAPTQTDPARRGALFALIDQGGFSAAPAPSGLGQLSFIRIPYQLVVNGAAQAPAVGLDPATVNSTTVAIVRVTGDGAPAVIAPALPPLGGAENAPGAVLLVPATGYVAGARYVVAMRGGPNGVRTADGQQMAASSAIFLLTNDVNLDDPDSRPSSVTPQQVADLKRLRLALAAPLDWGRVPPAGEGSATTEAICRANIPGIPDDPPFTEQRCWLPPPAPSAFLPAFNAVDLVFPRAEAVSIQTFEIAP